MCDGIFIFVIILSTQAEYASLLTCSPKSSLFCKWMKCSHSPIWLTGQRQLWPECVGSICTCLVTSWVNEHWCSTGEVNISAFILVTCLNSLFQPPSICSLKNNNNKNLVLTSSRPKRHLRLPVLLPGCSFIFLFLFFSFIWSLHPKSQGKWGNNNFVAFHLAHPEQSYF